VSENSRFLFFSSSKEGGIRKARVDTSGFARNALVGLAGSSWEEYHVAIGRGRINRTIKLRLPRGKARQITWMSTVPGNHDQVVTASYFQRDRRKEFVVQLDPFYLTIPFDNA